ncbi:MAG: 30S ribosomal protein S27ae [Candidatus Hadarchaeota archaeon]
MPKKQKAAKSKLYKLDKDFLKRARPTCPRCGPGVFMGEHKNRWACGKCGFTEFKK